MNEAGMEDEAQELYAFTVEPEGAGQRADKYLSAVCEDLSRARLQGLIAEGQVMLNGAPLKAASRRLEAGDRLEVSVPPPVPCMPQPENIPLDIVYEDSHLVVIDKPAGLVVHPGAGNWTGTLVNALLYHCKGELSGIGGVVRPGIVHRLDKDTGGLIVAAKTDQAHRHLAAQLADRSLSRIYQALVLGVPVPVKGVIDRAIGRDRYNRLKMSITEISGREACTRYLVLENFAQSCALVECALETGRTHQIRVHMDSIGHPLIGDPLYGPQPTALKAKLGKGGYGEDVVATLLSFPRQALHACKMSFVHPASEEILTFHSDIPKDFSNILKNIRK